MKVKGGLVLALLVGAHGAFAQAAEPSTSTGATGPQAPLTAAAHPVDGANAPEANGDAAWAQALDALVAGDLDAALSAATLAAADPAASSDRRAEAQDLAARIRKQKAGGRTNASRASSQLASAPIGAPPSKPAERAAAEQDAPDDRGGRAFLVSTTTLSGLALWGWTVPTALDIQNQRGTIGLYMLTAGASFGVPYLLTRRGPATWAMADMAWVGSTRGALAGLGVGTLITGNSGSDRGRAGSVLIGSMLGTLAGTLYANETRLTPGDANLIGLGGDVGALLGLGIAHLTGLDQLSEDPATRKQDRGVRMLAGFGLGGGVAGLLGGRFLGAHGAFTWGDAEVLRLPIALGVTGAAMIMDWEGTSSSRAIVGVLCVGGLGGAVLGERLVRERDFGVGQAFLLDLGTVAGALTAMGGVYLLTGSNNSKTYLTSGFIGGAAAFTALYTTLDAPPVHSLAMRLAPKGQPPSVSLLPYATASGAAWTRGLALAGNF